MNSTEEQMKERGYLQLFGMNETYLKMIFGSSEYILGLDTYQFDDYLKVLSTRFDPVAKAKRREEIFPKDCEKAFQMGARFAEK